MKTQKIDIHSIAFPIVVEARDKFLSIINPRVRAYIDGLNAKYTNHFFVFEDANGLKLIRVYNKRGLWAIVDPGGCDQSKGSVKWLDWAFSEVRDWLEHLDCEVDGLGYVPLDNTPPFDFVTTFQKGV